MANSIWIPCGFYNKHKTAGAAVDGAGSEKTTVLPEVDAGVGFGIVAAVAIASSSFGLYRMLPLKTG
jgi:hypothetical protein